MGDRMGSKAAARATATLTQAMAKTTDLSALYWLAQGLAAVADWLGNKVGQLAFHFFGDARSFATLDKSDGGLGE
jgi:hypothetical protein